jgi:two-component system KDP operon response regulator KdpE
MSTTSAMVLVIEDEPQMRRFIRASLSSHGYQVSEAASGAEALSLATSRNPAVILMDLGLPDIDGIDLTRRLREWSRVPVIVISARGRETDKVSALDAGADDYLTKPFGVDELLARIRVALRHASTTQSQDETPLEFGTLRIDLARREVRVAGEVIHLTPTEYKMLVLFARNAGRVITHRQIIREVWGPSYAGQNHHVRVHMAELRKKIETDPARPSLILTEPGVGYRLRD